MFSKKWFFDLESKLREMGLDSDEQSFDEILENLKHPKRVTPNQFAKNVSYVILASGFNQKTAKIKHKIIMDLLENNSKKDEILPVFKNESKIDAIIQVWNNRQSLCDGFYKCQSLEEKIVAHADNLISGTEEVDVDFVIKKWKSRMENCSSMGNM